ncbi:glycosyltransferase family 1 protein [Clostridium thermarum]|uniref:glycosyltransferase family 1 protein n=1 Tax=Clostridium thermarum TaxID=1716543 RepID=UPI0013D3F777|nr:glycosyltransferase family 1 protein [Clostridium thermarum]
MDNGKEKVYRVLHIIGGMNMGGAETMLMHLYRKIDKNTLQFDFVSFTEKECHYDREIQELGGRIFYAHPPKNTGVIKFVREIYKIIKKQGPYQAVHAHTLFNAGLTLLAARLAGVKIRICHSHNTSGDEGCLLSRKIYFAIMRLLIKINTTKAVACTHAAGEFLFGNRLDKKRRYTVLYNAVDLRPYLRVKDEEIISLRESLDITNNTLVIGHVGRFGEQKNHKFLIKVAEYLRDKGVDFKLLLIGQGDLKAKMEQLTTEKGLNKNIEFLGLQTNIPLFMKVFDVFLFPSLYEGLGIVLIEAQAAGTPCVISDTIPKECDMGLGLVKMVPLNENMEIWYQQIIESSRLKRVRTEVAVDYIVKKGYSLDSTVKLLKNLYELEDNT